MRVLAIDTSGPSVSVALLEGDRLLFECSLTHKRTHSVWLMPAPESGEVPKGKVNIGVFLLSCFVIVTCVLFILVLQGHI